MGTDNRFILEQAELLYDVRLVHEITTGNSGSLVFEVNKGENAYILRASEYSIDNKKHTAFELKWMEYLSDNLSEIVRPQKSLRNSLFEVINAGDKAYILCLFEKAPGKTVDIDNPEEFNEELFFHLGELMGEMHRLAVGYEDIIISPEFEWTGSVNAWRYESVIDDERVRLCLKKYYDEINRLPKRKDNYGIIHGDIHTDNFFVHSGKIKLFDFDACQFNWYAADIASAIFFMVLKGAGPLRHRREEERTEFAEGCLISYLRGYSAANTISEYWIRKIDLFMKYQMGDEYLYAQNYWPDELAHLRAEYLDWFKERITKDLPFVSVNYDKVLKSIPAI